MKSTIVGILEALGIIIFGASNATNRYGIFLDVLAILIVIGGTFTVAFITFPASEVFKIIRICWTVLQRKNESGNIVAKEIVGIAKSSRGEISALQQKMNSIKHPFLKDAIGLIVDRIDANEMESILNDRIRVKQELDASASNMLRTLAKYPPSLGIIGTVLGLIGVIDPRFEILTKTFEKSSHLC